VQRVRPADEVDKLYGETLRQALAAGVYPKSLEMQGGGKRVNPHELR
jgi:DNA-binding sugar fermentation-stimulating protein